MEASTRVPAHRAMWNPVAPVGRSWRRLRRRPRAMQVRTAVIVVAIVVALVAWLAFAPSGTPGGSGAAGASEVAERDQPSSDPREPGEHERPRRLQGGDQRRLPRGRDQQPGGQGRVRAGQGVQRAGRRHQPLRQPDQQVRWDQRAQDQPDDRSVRPDQRRQHAGAVPAVDRGQPGGVRGGGRDRDLDRRQPTVRRAAGTDPAPECLVHHDELDQLGLALPVVDRARTWRRCWRPPCSGG